MKLTDYNLMKNDLDKSINRIVDKSNFEKFFKSLINILVI